MKRMHKQSLFALIMISITVLAVVLVCIQMVDITRMLAEQKRDDAAGRTLDDVEQDMSARVKEVCDRIAEDVYQTMLSEENRTGGNSGMLANEDRNEYYIKYIDAVKEYFGEDSLMVSKLRECIPEVEDAELKLGDAPSPSLYVDYDEKEGKLNKYEFRDVVVWYMKNGEAIQKVAYDMVIEPPDIEFSSAAFNIGDYSMIGMKGIYITGQTSTIVGNVYAGTHEYEEGREEEYAYGEKDPYGGINILTTQLGLYAGSVVTTGDINIKGAFVILGDEDEEISVYANTLNEIEHFPDNTEYTLNGNLFLQSDTTGFTDSEYYDGVIREMGKQTVRLKAAEAYVSDEDETYTGEYSRIISGEDVVLDSDFTGTVMTSGSIVVEEGVNVEGLLMAGGRIYVRGNNNIVANEEVVNL